MKSHSVTFQRNMLGNECPHATPLSGLVKGLATSDMCLNTDLSSFNFFKIKIERVWLMYTIKWIESLKLKPHPLLACMKLI